MNYLYNIVFRMVFLIVGYINKMATNGGGGVVDGRHSNNCKHNIGRGGNHKKNLLVK